MEALYDRTGRVYAWLHETGNIYGLRGENLAFVDNNSVYSWSGAHIAWWQDGHIRDHSGAAALFTAAATNIGVVRPVRSVRPVQPIRSIAPIKPMKSMRPMRSMKRLAWSDQLPF